MLDYLITLKRTDSSFVLMYHRVLESCIDEPVFVQPGMYVTAKNFRRQINFLKKKFNVIPLAELVERVAAGKSVGGCCAITFDDGWYDNFTSAFPILQEFQVPATFFIATAFIGTNRMFWPEELTFYLKQPEVMTSIGQSKMLDRLFDEVGGADATDGYMDNAVTVLKAWLPHEREKICQELRVICPASHPNRLLMNWQEVEKMQDSGLISFGSHTANHVILDQVSLQMAEEEIISSYKEIESRLGTFSRLFAYPNGNHSKDIQDILKRNDFSGAVTTRRGWVNGNVGLFAIPRIGIHEDVSSSMHLFFARILLERF
jgi:peptidoglycan/xylan/chitin deacetylase (PgdA/CDA1 family)